jgi:hypothetical protein
MAWAMAKACLGANTAQPLKTEEPPMNTATVTTTAATVSPFIQNLQQQQPQKPQTSKEAIAANVKALIEQLEEGHSEGLTAYLTAMGRFHNYSFGNILEIARQKAVT